jgi:hypothetical protein
MKRLLALLLCLAVTLSFAACSNTKPSDNPTTAPTSTEVYNDETLPNGIRANGYLPDDESELTDEEIRYYVGIVMNAALDLDVDTLRKYAKNEKDLEAYQRIADDPVTKTFFMETDGKSIYLESTGEIVYPECEAVFCMWYTDLWKNGKTPPADVTQLSAEELLSIYDQYSEKIPYVFNEVTEVTPESNYQISLKDGNIYFELNELLGCTSYCYDIEDLAPSEYHFNSPSKHLAAYVFGYGIDELDQTLDESLQSRNYEFIMPMLNYDLDSLPAFMDSLQKEHDRNDDIGAAFYAEYYKNYIKDKEQRAKVQSWMKDNLVCGFDIYSFRGWYTVSADDYYLFSELTEEDKELLKDVWVCDWLYTTSDVSADNAFAPYCDIISMMIDSGLLEDCWNNHEIT